LKLKPACKWCAFLRSRAWTASDQRKSLLRKKAVALVGWMGEACAGGGRQQEGQLAAAAKLASMSVLVSVPQQLITAALRVLLMPN
jgi:hypothetical protein